jgi:REP element-mobilizing transposase RayT
MAARFEVEVLAYVLMNNHYHLLLKTKRGNLCKSLQWFGVTYTRDIAIYLLWEMGWYIRIVRLGRFLGLVIRR